jgi:hypothetical protein
MTIFIAKTNAGLVDSRTIVDRGSTVIDRPNSDNNMRELAKKEWRRPSLQRLPIAATAGSKGRAGDEGNTSKNGDANPMS